MQRNTCFLINAIRYNCGIQHTKKQKEKQFSASPQQRKLQHHKSCSSAHWRLSEPGFGGLGPAIGLQFSFRARVDMVLQRPKHCLHWMLNSLAPYYKQPLLASLSSTWAGISMSLSDPGSDIWVRIFLILNWFDLTFKEENYLES